MPFPKRVVISQVLMHYENCTFSGVPTRAQILPNSVPMSLSCNDRIFFFRISKSRIPCQQNFYNDLSICERPNDNALGRSRRLVTKSDEVRDRFRAEVRTSLKWLHETFHIRQLVCEQFAYFKPILHTPDRLRAETGLNSAINVDLSHIHSKIYPWGLVNRQTVDSI